VSAALVAGCAIVTGGGSGIGRAIASTLARDGAYTVVVDLLPDGGTQTVESIIKSGGRATFLQADVSDWDEVDGIFGKVRAQLGPVGIVVNAAGVLDGYAPADEISAALWNRVIAINLSGTFFACKRALEEMVPAGRGRIINLASVAGVSGAGGGPAYVASKHGVVGLTRQLAVAYADRGVTVNAICPGAVSTGLRANSTEILGPDAPVMRGVGGDDSLVRAVTPAGRRGTVDEIAAAARFLAGEDAGYITGHTLVIDGGWTAR
jgi:NAD(P)-dependent dehydrogenase (short-subunit alcohol dehydrogenase family)